jgi:hypothetical protein
MAARAQALRCCVAADDAAESIGRAAARLKVYLGVAGDAAELLARRSLLHAGDAAFHDQLLGCGRTDILRMAVERTTADDLTQAPSRGGMLAISLHYGPATSILPLWLAKLRARGVISEFGVIENSRRNPSVMLSPRRHAELEACGFPFADLDIATLGEVGAMRRALAILRNGGVVLIFADGQLPPPGAKRTLTCRLGHCPLALAQGAQWLAQSADVPLLPLWLRPQGDSYAVAALAPQSPSQAGSAVQSLLDATMAADPAPWGRWCSSAAHL